MKVKTTIHICAKDAAKLARAEKRLNIGRKELISALVNHFARRRKDQLKLWGRVRYQPPRDRSEWRRLHITIRGDEYEFFIDVRKVHKLSVSFIVAYAINNYLDIIFTPGGNEGDNYPYYDYAIKKFETEGVVCCLLCWGIPHKLLKKTP